MRATLQEAVRVTADFLFSLEKKKTQASVLGGFCDL